MRIVIMETEYDIGVTFWKPQLADGIERLPHVASDDDHALLFQLTYGGIALPYDPVPVFRVIGDRFVHQFICDHRIAVAFQLT